MTGRILKFGGKAVWWGTKRVARGYRTESAIALGLLGAALATREVLKARNRATAMCGKVVLIMGGSRGLGLEIARQFGLAGAHLVLVSRNDEELRAALATLHSEGAIPNGSAAHTVTADITKPEDCERVVRSANERYGRVDVLVNCAAAMAVAPFADMPLETFQTAMQVNFFGQLHAIQAVLPQMLERGSGAIVNIASVGGKMAVPHMLPYVASKFALVGLSEGLHAELRHKGIRVTTVCPGLMRTGSHNAVQFAGNSEKEHRWFKLAATLPLVSVSARRAAAKIYAAVVEGRAEITITPQAWLAARATGLFPETTAQVSAAINEFALPNANGNRSFVRGEDIDRQQREVKSLHLLHSKVAPAA